MGRADYLDLGDWNAICYRCGRKRKASTMQRQWQGYWVCQEHWEPRQPQDFVRGIVDIQTPPWVQPPPTDVFAAFCTPTGRTGYAGYGVAGCMIPSYIDPSFPGTPPPISAASVPPSFTWPPSLTSFLTVVYGVASIHSSGGGVPNGSLDIFNNTGTDSAYVYLNSIPATTVTSRQAVSVPFWNVTPSLQGVYSRATLQATPTVLQNGYRGDYFLPILRILRFTAGVPTTLATLDLTGYAGGFYTNTGNGGTFNFVDNGPGNTMELWLSSPGQPDTTHVTATGAATTPFASGRIGFLSFVNIAGSGGPTAFSSYSAVYTP